MVILGELCEATAWEPRKVYEGALMASKSF
jgi:hypothetical protein